MTLRLIASGLSLPRLAVMGVVLVALQACPRLQAQDSAVADARAQLKLAFDDAQQLIDSEQYLDAVDAYGELITRTGNYVADPYLKRAFAYFKLENYEKAIDDLNGALTYASDQPKLLAQVRALRGEVYLEEGNPANYADALEDLKAAVDDIRDDPNLQFLYGKAQMLNGQGQAGIETLTKYLTLEGPRLEERAPEVFRLRAQAFASVRRFDDAKADLANASQLEPENHENHALKASILMVEEAYPEAAQAFADVIRTYKPADENDDLPPISAYLTRAVALEEIGRVAPAGEERQNAYNASKETVTTLLGLLPDRPQLAPTRASAEFRLGIVERLLGNLPGAIKSLTAAIDLNPQGPPELLGNAYFRRGICFYYLQEEELALLDFEAAAGLLEFNPRAKYWIGRTYAKQTKYLDAIRSYGEAVAVSDRYSDAFVHRGLAYFNLDEYDKAIKDFNEAIRIKPEVGTPFYYRGYTYARLGDTDKAINSLTNAIKFAPELLPAYRALSNQLRVVGQETLAAEYDRKASEIETQKASGSGTR